MPSECEVMPSGQAVFLGFHDPDCGSELLEKRRPEHTGERIQRDEDRVRGILDDYLSRPEEDFDAAEDALLGDERDEDPLPPELRGKSDRLARLRAAKKRLTDDREAREQAAAQRVADWQERKRATGRPGRKPTATPKGPASGKPPRANTTDPDSRAMKCQHTLVQDRKSVV